MKDTCPCNGCNDRVAVPNCHSTCEKYVSWNSRHQERRAKAREQKRYYDDITSYIVDACNRHKKIRKSSKDR